MASSLLQSRKWIKVVNAAFNCEEGAAKVSLAVCNLRVLSLISNAIRYVEDAPQVFSIMSPASYESVMY